MTQILRSALCLGIFAMTAMAQTASFFPIKEGNMWTYREVGGDATFTIRVGLPVSTLDGRLYYSLQGYVDQRVLVRRNEFGNLVWYNDEFLREELLTSFEIVPGARFNAPFRPCESEGQVQEKRRPYDKLADREGTALAIVYRNHGCADTGVESEEYVENIGMVRRTVQTIAGPKTYELVSAWLGSVSIAPESGVRYNIELRDLPGAEPKLGVTMRIGVPSSQALQLQFPTSQDYDIVVRNAAGDVVYRWSEGQAFLQVVRQVQVSGERRFETDVPLKSRDGAPLPEGQYTLEAWITSGDSGRQFSATAPFSIHPKLTREVR